MAWVYLITAGLFEIGWAVGLKYTNGFTRLWPSVWTLDVRFLTTDGPVLQACPGVAAHPKDFTGEASEDAS